MQGRFSNKLDPVMTQCGDAIASRGDQLITFDLPGHGDRQDGKAFSPMVAGPPHTSTRWSRGSRNAIRPDGDRSGAACTRSTPGESVAMTGCTGQACRIS